MTSKSIRLCVIVLVGMSVLDAAGHAAAPTPLLIAYGGHNETMVPLWVGIAKGIFHKYGVDPQVLQTRSGPIMMATLVSGGTPLVWSAPSSAVSTTASGLKLGCFAVGNNRVPREVIVRKGIESIDDLRGKSFGVQSIGVTRPQHCGGSSMPWASTRTNTSSTCASSATPARSPKR